MEGSAEVRAGQFQSNEFGKLQCTRTATSAVICFPQVYTVVQDRPAIYSTHDAGNKRATRCFIIKQRNLAELPVQLRRGGSAAVAANADCILVPFVGAIKAVSVKFGVVGVDGTGSPTTDLLVDIFKNGTTLLATTKITFDHTAAATTPSTYGDWASATCPTVAEGDILSLGITQIYNGTSPTQPINLVVGLLLARANAPLPAKMITGSF